MSKQWIVIRENFDGQEKIIESKIHAMNTETVTACGRVVDPEYMRIMSEDCEWRITDVRVVEYPDKRVTCRLCLR